MTLKERAKDRAEKLYGDPTGDKVITVYVVASTYKNYKRFLSMRPVDASQYRYLYDEYQLTAALKNLLPLSEIQLLFLPFWFKHPRALSIFEATKKLDSSLLKPLYSDNMVKYIPRTTASSVVENNECNRKSEKRV